MRCVICTDPFYGAVGIVSTKCGHVFHTECLLKWIENSETCPECRGPVSKKNIRKLKFNIAPTNEALLENEKQSLKSKLRKKDMAVESSKQEIVELQAHFRNLKKVAEKKCQREIELKYEIFCARTKLKLSNNLHSKVLKLKQENKKLSKELELYNNEKTKVTGPQKDVGLFHEMQSDGGAEIGSAALFRFGTHGAIPKYEPNPVVEGHLCDEVTDSKERLVLSTTSLQNNEWKVKKFEEQLKSAHEMNNSLLAQRGALIPNSNTVILKETPLNNSSSSKKAVNKKGEMNSLLVQNTLFSLNFNSIFETTSNTSSTSSEETIKNDELSISDEMNNSLLAQNTLLIPNSNTSILEATSNSSSEDAEEIERNDELYFPDKINKNTFFMPNPNTILEAMSNSSSTSFEEITEKNDELPISFEALTVKKD